MGDGIEGREQGHEVIRKRKCTKGILTSRVVMLLLEMRCAERWKVRVERKEMATGRGGDEKRPSE